MGGEDTTPTRRRVLQVTSGALATGAVSSFAAAEPADTVEANVGFQNPAGKQAALDASSDVKREFGFEAVTIRGPKQRIEALRNNPNVRYVEENGRMHAFEQTTPYGIEITDADIAIDDGNTGSGVDVAIIDTGIDAQHETLQENLGAGFATTDAECTTSCSGGPFGGGGNDISECLEVWDDDNDHGSHCAGTAGAADNGVGVLGVAPNVTLHAVKVLQCDGSGSFDDIAAGIEWSAEQGHDVQSMSLGADSDSSVVTDAVEFAAGEGVTMVAAAGNDGPCSDCVGFPARHPEVIAVSATDSNDQLADFSSTGPEVEIAAPGVNTLSTVPRDDYTEFSGTSMACPHVSGAAATLIAADGLSRSEVRSRLKDTADDIGLADNEQGAGRLNVADAVGSDGTTESVSVTTGSASDVTDTAATLNGELTELSGADSADVFFEYGESGGSLSNTTATQTLSGTGTFSATIDGLQSGTEYEFRAVAQTTNASDTGGTATFTTGSGDGTTAPVIDSWSVSTKTSGPWFRVTSTWAVSDADGNLDAVTTELLSGGSVVESTTTAVSGSSASGEDEVRTRSSVDEVRLVVSDTDGETATSSQTV